MAVPKHSEMFGDVLSALREMDGSGTIAEIDARVTDKLIASGRITEEDSRQLHDPERGDRTAIEYRLAWARTYLKSSGYLENSTRGVWALTQSGRETETLNPQAILKAVQRKVVESNSDNGVEVEPQSESIEPKWQIELLSILKKIEPSAFERLCQRLLREAGFIQVEVTGKSGDGGIDGRGIMKLGALLSFHVIFQCKRYEGQVGSGAIRDFRGAMVGRADKGLFITTGGFTREAVKEAIRDGAPPVELIDGDALCELLKQYSLGVITEQIQVEKVSLTSNWFNGL